MNKMEQMEKRIAELEAKFNSVTVSQGGTLPWQEASKHIRRELDKLGLDKVKDNSNLHTGITAVIRYSLDVRTVRNISQDMVPQATDIADRIIGMVKEHRDELVETIERGD